jgi:hypothetical protein
VLEPDAALEPELDPEPAMEFDPLPDALKEPELEVVPEFTLGGVDPELAFEPLLAPLNETDPEKRKETISVTKKKG